MGHDVVTIMKSAKQEAAQLFSDVIAKRLFSYRKDSLIAVVILDNLQSNQLIIPLLDQATNLKRPSNDSTYNEIRNQSLIVIDPRFKIEIQKFDVTMFGTVFRAELLRLHPALVLTWQVETATVLTEGLATAMRIIGLASSSSKGNRAQV